MSMPVITLTPSSKTGIASPPEISKNEREASFSSYLDGAEATFVLKLGAARTISTSHDHILLGKNTTHDREIDVFDAEKYFNEGLNHTPKVCPKDLSNHHHHKKDAPVEIIAIKEKPPTSIHSESSCNSRSALLHSISRNQKPRKANKKKSFLATIGCNCSCADNYSTDIDETSSIKSRSTGLVDAKGDKTRHHLVRKSHSDTNFGEPQVREEHFTFPVFNSKKEEAAKRKVFGSPVMEKKLSMMTWDAIAPSSVSEEIKIPSISSEMHNDSDSDSSSDLFEIESLSKGNPFLSRQASEGYAPSEASIEWSVITASAADFSLLSDSEEFTVPCPKKVGINSKFGSFKEIPKLRPSGCKNHRAVSVAGDAHIPTEQDISKSITLMTRFHHESKVTKSRQQSFDGRILSQKRPANSAHLLYT